MSADPNNEDMVIQKSKVRMACRRCRAKRIKCDGQVPACGNCQKAHEPCIDVDTRNSAVSIPRDFAFNARARIEWLEEQLRQLSPTFNFADGPKVDFQFMTGQQPSNDNPQDHSVAILPSTSNESRPVHLNAQSVTHGKRSYSFISENGSKRPFPDEARSVAIDLGMLSLNSDSRTTHYLGSSSGRLFTSLLGLGTLPNSSDSPSSDNLFSTPQPSVSIHGKNAHFAFSKQLKSSYRKLVDTLKKTLPPKEDARMLLDNYIKSIHVDHPFIHCSSIINALDALYQTAAADSSVPISHNGWVEDVEAFAYNGELEMARGMQCTPISIFMATFHVFMVFTLAATTIRRNYDFAPNQFYRVAMSVAPECFSRPSIASLQATLFLSVHSLLAPADLNIWILTHIAMAHCIDLGLHRTAHGDKHLEEPALITRKMLFFCVYNLDRSVATIQGRPLGIRDETFDVKPPTLDSFRADNTPIRDPELVPETPIEIAIIFALHRFKLDKLISEIKLVLYHLPSEVNALVPSDDLDAQQVKIRQNLENWLDELSVLVSGIDDELQFDLFQVQKYQMKLQCQYYAAMVLLYQPSQAIPRPTEDAVALCYQNSARRLMLYNDLYNADSLYLSWRSIQGIFSSGATIIYCLWTSNEVRRSTAYPETVKILRICENLLSAGGEWWPSVKKGKESFARAMDALMGRLTADQKAVDRDHLRCGHPPSQQHTIPISTAMLASHSSNEVHLAHPDLVNMQNQYSDHMPVNSSIIAGESGSASQYDMAYFNPRPSDGFIAFGPADHPGEMFDPTIEAFIAEYLEGDTAWNPF